jgi:multiple sugar transport system permease protein
MVADTLAAGQKAPPRSLSPRSAMLRRHGTSLLLLAPFLALFVIFVVWPLIQSLYLSFTKFNGIRAATWIGFDNYANLFADERFLKAVTNTLLYVAGTVIITTLLSLALGLAFRGEGWWHRILRVVFFLPAVTSSIALALLWRWIFSPEEYGMANTIRGWFGADPIGWLSTPSLAVPVLIIMSVWGGMGYGMIIFVAGLNAIPDEYYESAKLDGATTWQQFRRITLPLLRPVSAYVIITGLIGAFQIFEAAYIVFTQPGLAGNVGGVLDSALFIVPYLYEMGFQRFQLGYASAIAWVLFIIIFVISMINLRLSRTNEDQ